MADSKLAPPKPTLSEKDVGIIRQAMAYKVKYRKHDGQKIIIPIRLLGCHPLNRGGIYPQSERCQKLCSDVVSWGYDREDAEHNGVCVEEIPTTERRFNPMRPSEEYETYLAWNKKNTMSDSLKKCFEEGDVSFGLLAHSHLLVIQLCILTGAQWDVCNEDQDRPAYCDADGCLSLSAVAELDANMAAHIREGMKVEVLSWKMYQEEPQACIVISQAMNKGHEAALRTSELTAMSVLSGAITLRQEVSLATQIEFESIRDALRSQLDYVVDEPEFIALFELVIGLGANSNSFIPDFMAFTNELVDQSKRQLRLNAYGIVSKMSVDVPRCKIAVLKRAFRKKPVHGWCPSPEAAWMKYEGVELKFLEELLHFFHVTCKPAVAALPQFDKVNFLANVDCAATEAFYGSTCKGTLQTTLLEATVKYGKQVLENFADSKSIAPLAKWINYEKASAVAEQKAAVASKKQADARLTPKVIDFDEATGQRTNAQDEREATNRAQGVIVKVPWKLWLNSDMGLSAGAVTDDINSALMVLHMLHLRAPLADQPFDVDFDVSTSKIRVVSTRDVEAGEIWLPPCIPKGAKLHETSTYPLRVPITVRRRSHSAVDGAAVAAVGAAVAEAAGAAEPSEAVRTVYAHAEWKLPEGEAQRDGTMQWTWKGAETLHPYWAVRRATAAQLKRQR
jgi:hypothetical protein